MPNELYIIHPARHASYFDWAEWRPNAPCVGPFSDYHGALDMYMSTVIRADRQPILVSNEFELMECVDAVTRLVGRKPSIKTAGSAWDANVYEITLEVALPILTLHYALDIDYAEGVLRAEGYIVNEIGVHI